MLGWFRSPVSISTTKYTTTISEWFTEMRPTLRHLSIHHDRLDPRSAISTKHAGSHHNLCFCGRDFSFFNYESVDLHCFTLDFFSLSNRTLAR
jgi:hypothetical protein